MGSFIFSYRKESRIPTSYLRAFSSDPLSKNRDFPFFSKPELRQEPTFMKTSLYRCIANQHIHETNHAIGLRLPPHPLLPEELSVGASRSRHSILCISTCKFSCQTSLLSFPEAPASNHHSQPSCIQSFSQSQNTFLLWSSSRLGSE